MKNKCIVIAVVLCLAVYTTPFAQSRYGISKITAFQQAVQMGNIPIDETGNQMRKGADTSFSVFIETKGGSLPKWGKAYRAGMAYSLSLIDSTKKDNETLIAARGHVIKPEKGNKLWRYELVLLGKDKLTNNYLAANITLTGTFNKLKVVIPIKSIVTLQPELRP